MGQRQTTLEVGANVPECRNRRRVWVGTGLWTRLARAGWCTATASVACCLIPGWPSQSSKLRRYRVPVGSLPNTREIRFSVGGSRWRRVELYAAFRVSRNASLFVLGPLSGDRNRTYDDNGKRSINHVHLRSPRQGSGCTSFAIIDTQARTTARPAYRDPAPS